VISPGLAGLRNSPSFGRVSES